MTFRPSVLPDRDNDILSTFTRSFERARQLVRQDQADRRAQQAFELQQEERRQALEDRRLEFDLKVAEDPALSFRDITPEQAELAQALGADPRTGGFRAPTLPGTRDEGGFIDPQQVDIPEDVLPAGTPGDVEIVGQRGGRTLTRSQTVGDIMRRRRLSEEAEFEETLPAARRERRDEAETRESVENLLGLGALTDPETDEPIPPGTITDPDLAADLIEQERAARFSRRRGVDVAATPRPRTGGSGGRSPEDIAFGQARGRILSNFQQELDDERRQLTANESTSQRLQREISGDPAPEPDRAAVLERVIRQSRTAQDITDEQMNQMLQDIPNILRESGGGGGAPRGAEGGESGGGVGLSDAEVTQVTSILRRAGSITEAEITEDLQAEGFTPEEIAQVLAAMR